MVLMIDLLFIPFISLLSSKLFLSVIMQEWFYGSVAVISLPPCTCVCVLCRLELSLYPTDLNIKFVFSCFFEYAFRANILIVYSSQYVCSKSHTVTTYQYEVNCSYGNTNY